MNASEKTAIITLLANLLAERLDEAQLWQRPQSSRAGHHLGVSSCPADL